MHYPTNILMIRPASFGFNEQTAGSNAFQNRNTDEQQVQDKALKEFDAFVDILRSEGVNIIAINNTPEPHTPDAIFPNNWISFHSTGDVLLYPMQAHNRRLERREDIINHLEDRFKVRHIIDLSRYEQQDKFLEGTGSLVLDRGNKLAYACLSPRTNLEVLNVFCKQAGYTPVVFHAFDRNKQAIYHTNVMMCLADRYVVICLDSITDGKEREAIVAAFYCTQKTIFEISFEQMNQFASNMLEVFNANGDSLLVMSGSAYNSLSPQQIATIQQFSKVVKADIPTIERIGGGSVRCMMAEVALPLNK